MQGMYKAPLDSQLSGSNHRTINPKPSNLRVYQVWKGNNRFFLGGRLIFGPDARSIFLTVCLIVIPVILFCAFDSQSLIREFQELGHLILLICIVFTIYVIVLLLLTSARDPGIIPRRSHPPEIDGDCAESTVSSEWPGSHSGIQNVPPTKDVLVNGIMVRVKYCQTCMLYRPPRCSHCSICNNCVERFDHHCPWVGQCIGKRNYRFFFMFVSSLTMLCLYVFAFCWVNIKNVAIVNHCSLWRAIVKSPVSGILILYTFVASWFVGGLTAFHLYLIMTNQTTYENFRYRYDRRRNPYNRGCIRNVGGVFFSKIPRSKNKLREKVKPDSSSALSMSRGHAMSPELPKRSLDLEMGKRQAVAAEDFDEIHSQIDSIGAMERCETMPRLLSWDSKPNWDGSPDIRMLGAEFGTERGLPEREKIEGGSSI